MMSSNPTGVLAAARCARAPSQLLLPGNDRQRRVRRVAHRRVGAASNEERRKLDDAQRDFAEYVDVFPRAKDREEFDRFMAERRNRPAGDSVGLLSGPFAMA